MSEPGALPDLRLLGYSERRPVLRIIRLARERFEPAPVSIDRGYALDECIRRDGWLAFRPNIEVWGVPLPFGGKPFRISANAGAVPAVDPRSVWLTLRGQSTGAIVSGYDGTSRTETGVIELPEGFTLAGEVPEGFVLKGEHSGLFRWRPDGGDPVQFVDARTVLAFSGSRLACLRVPSEPLLLIDFASGMGIEVDPPDGSAWGAFASFSPDGTRLAIDVDFSDRSGAQLPTPRDLPSLKANVKARLYQRIPHRLAVIDVADGTTGLADAGYDNYARPVWSNDSRWVVFNAPFDQRGLWFCDMTTLGLRRVEFQTNPPTPLLDVSDLFA